MIPTNCGLYEFIKTGRVPMDAVNQFFNLFERLQPYASTVLTTASRRNGVPGLCPFNPEQGDTNVPSDWAELSTLFSGEYDAVNKQVIGPFTDEFSFGVGEELTEMYGIPKEEIAIMKETVAPMLATVSVLKDLGILVHLDREENGDRRNHYVVSPHISQRTVDFLGTDNIETVVLTGNGGFQLPIPSNPNSYGNMGFMRKHPIRSRIAKYQIGKALAEKANHNLQ